jgi:hypothetical protein
MSTTMLAKNNQRRAEPGFLGGLGKKTSLKSKKYQLTFLN